MKFKRMRNNPPPIPTRATDGSAGYDLAAADGAVIDFGGGIVISTGWSVEIPPGHVGFVKERSSIAIRGCVADGFVIVDDKGSAVRAGVIDSDYRGEILVMLRNESPRSVAIVAGSRIAQLVVIPCVLGNSVEVDDLDDTGRGTGGFGSTDR